MRKSLMSNIRDFVDTNVRNRIDKASNNNSDFFDPDLLLVEGHFDELRRFCIEAEKRMAAVLQSVGTFLNTNTALTSGSSQSALTSNSLYQNLSAIAAVASNSSSTGFSSSNLNQSNNSNTSKCQSPSSLDGYQLTNETNFKLNVPSSSPLIDSSQHQHKQLILNGTNTQADNPDKNIPYPSLKQNRYSSQNKLSFQEQVQQPNLNQNRSTCDRFGSINSEQSISANAEEVITNVKGRKKLPIIGFLKFLTKSRHKLKHESLLAKTLTQCTILQSQLTQIYLNHEQTVDAQCLKPLRDIIDIDIPNVIKLRKQFIKSHNDLESLKVKFNLACQKQRNVGNQHNNGLSNHFSTATYSIIQTNNLQSSANNKLDILKREIDEATTKFEQSRDTYATELYIFVCRETELVNLLIKFYAIQEEYKQQAAIIIRESLPTLNSILVKSPKKLVFGTKLEEHIHCLGRPLSLVIELCTHLLYSHGLNEEGLFRVPGSSVKIKKLKNAINAWFVTLGSQGDSQSQQHQTSSIATCHSPSQRDDRLSPNIALANEPSKGALLAIHNLFKDMASHQPRIFDYDQVESSLCANIKSSSSCSSSTADDQYQSPQTTPHLSSNPDPVLTLGPCSSNLVINDDRTLTNETYTNSNHQVCYDVHTISGLLKLYLRDLPEPLFTFDLYYEWIDATNKCSDLLRQHLKLTESNDVNYGTDNRSNHSDGEHTETNKISLDHDAHASASAIKACLSPLMNVIGKLPQIYYDNLAHLIKFLHLVTTYSDSNKMTASNLSLTMAPSLLRPRMTQSIQTTNPICRQLSSSTGGDQSPSSSGSLADCQQFYSKSIKDQHSTNDDSMSNLNAQMTNMGMSTSIHALVIETLIKYANEIFPETINFQISLLEQQNNCTSSNINMTINQSSRTRNLGTSEARLSQHVLADDEARRKLASVSPTGLSITSSSSFSSSSSSSNGVAGNHSPDEPPPQPTYDHQLVTEHRRPRLPPPPIPPLPKNMAAYAGALKANHKN